MSLKAKLVWIVGVYAVLLLVAAVWSNAWTSRVDDFVKLLAAWFTVLTSALAAAVSLLVMSGQRMAAQELEQLRIGAGNELEALRQSGQNQLEGLKTQLAHSIKVVEFSMGQAGRASEAVSLAMSDYYYALAALENGEFVGEDLMASDRAMRRARARLIDLLPEVTKAFDLFWQSGANIAGELRGLGPTPAASEMRELWKRHVKMFGEQLKSAEQALLASQREARHMEAAGSAP